MPDTFTQLFVHVIFSIQNKEYQIEATNEQEIYHYIEEIVCHRGHQLLIIGGTEDHIHLLMKLNPAKALSDLIREVKKQSSLFINRQFFTPHSFHWQEGYNAFTLTRNQVNTIFKFIEKQKEYHKNKNFKEEYLSFTEVKDIFQNEETIFKYKYR